LIDGHVHIGKTEKCSRVCSAKNLNGYADQYLVMPNISSIIASYESNEMLLDEIKDRNDCSVLLLIDPHSANLYEQIILNLNKISGLKYHPSVHQVEVSNPRLARYLNKLDGKILLVHCGRNDISDFGYILRAAKTYPKINFIAAHLGGLAVDKIESAMKLIGLYGTGDNIYFDTSGVPNPWIIEKMILIVGVNKIIFGSDMPYHDFNIAEYTIRCLNLTAEEKGRIFEGNLRELLQGKLQDRKESENISWVSDWEKIYPSSDASSSR